MQPEKPREEKHSENLDVRPAQLDGQREVHGKTFPQVLRCQSEGGRLEAAVRWVGSRRDQLLAELDECGVILFRGFPLRTDHDFDVFVAAFGLENFPYAKSLSNAVRINRTERVFTANEAPSEVSIFLHHEMAQTPFYPRRIFFFCEKPAEAGGATPVCRSDALFERLVEEYPDFARDCEAKGLRYTNVMPPDNDPASGMGRSWRSTLSVETNEEAERRLAELGYSWEWLEDGCLRATTPVLPAVRGLDSDGGRGARPRRRVFFNQLIAAFKGWKDSRNDPAKSITFGDGTPLDRDAALGAAALAEEVTVDLAWQRGDVAFVDNYLVMHGRRPFEGTRHVLASLTV